MENKEASSAELGLRAQIEKFASGSESRLAFSPSLSREDRQLVHNIAESLGLGSISEGVSDLRHVVVFKMDASEAAGKEKTMVTEAARRRFVKDFDLPIPVRLLYSKLCCSLVVASPLFEYYLETFDRDFQTLSKFKVFSEAVNRLKGEPNLAKESSRIKDAIINDIKKTKAFEDFSTVSESKFRTTSEAYTNASWSSSDAYKQPNAGKIFISIDLTSANFNSLRKLIGSDVVLGVSSWSELIAKYTALAYFKQSKAFRQLIFGNLNPNKQKVLISHICRTFLDRLITTQLKSRITNVLADEIVIETSLKGLQSDLDALKTALSDSEFSDIVHLECFKLVWVSPRSYFVKEIFKMVDLFRVDVATVAKRSFKCIPATFFAQVYKKYYGEEILDKDRKFVHEGFVATFDSTIFDEK